MQSQSAGITGLLTVYGPQPEGVGASWHGAHSCDPLHAAGPGESACGIRTQTAPPSRSAAPPLIARARRGCWQELRAHASIIRFQDLTGSITRHNVVTKWLKSVVKPEDCQESQQADAG